MKVIYLCFYYSRSCYLNIIQDVCFYFTRKKFYCYSYNSLKVLESPGKVLEKSWKKLKKVLESRGIWIIFFGGNHEAVKGCQNLTNFFAAITRWLIRCFFFFFLSFFPNLLCSFYLNLILFCLYFLLEIKNIIKNKLARSYVRQYSFIKNITLISFELITLQVVGNSHQCLY